MGNHWHYMVFPARPIPYRLFFGRENLPGDVRVYPFREEEKGPHKHLYKRRPAPPFLAHPTFRVCFVCSVEYLLFGEGRSRELSHLVATKLGMGVYHPAQPPLNCIVPVLSAVLFRCACFDAKNLSKQSPPSLPPPPSRSDPGSSGV